MSTELTKKKATEVDGFDGYEDAAEGAEIERIAAKLLLLCRTIYRSAQISPSAVSLRQKQFAIGMRDDKDRPTVAA